VPLKPPKVSEVNLPAGHSAALEAQALLGPGVRVAAGLHHVSSAHLAEPDHEIDCDVLVCANDEEARTVAVGLVKDLGLRAFDAGALKNAVALESLTAVLIHLNKKYKVPSSGIRITGIP
jgi:NADPH-dependent F420 reductase